jgi:DNA mismatch repair ATPase MutS
MVLLNLKSLVSLAIFAKEFSLIRPVVTESKIFEFEDAFHPIQKLCVEQFIPNNLKFNGTTLLS